MLVIGYRINADALPIARREITLVTGGDHSPRLSRSPRGSQNS
jgi:hypothetical protein